MSDGSIQDLSARSADDHGRVLVRPGAAPVQDRDGLAGLRHGPGHREPDRTGEAVFSERIVGPFQRTIALPADVDAEGATARLVAGLLMVAGVAAIAL